MMGNVELYHQYRWRELAQAGLGRFVDRPEHTAPETTAIQAFGLGLIRLGARLAGPAFGRTVGQN